MKLAVCPLLVGNLLLVHSSSCIWCEKCGEWKCVDVTPGCEVRVSNNTMEFLQNCDITTEFGGNPALVLPPKPPVVLVNGLESLSCILFVP